MTAPAPRAPAGGDEAGLLADLTVTQFRALRWLHENQHHSSEWTVNGRPLRNREPFEKAQHMLIKGHGGSILIHKSDCDALWGFTTAMGRSDRLWDVNEAGLALLASANPERGK